VATLTGFLLRINDLGRVGLGTDEGHSAWMAAQPLADLADLLRVDSAPPLFYALLHVWQGWFPSDAGLRALSVLAGVAAIPVLYLIGRRLLGEAGGVAAALFMAVANFHIRFSQIAKNNALFFLVAVLALLALLRACGAPSRRSARISWAAYGLVLAGLLYTHAVAPFFIAGLGLVFLIRTGPRYREHLVPWLSAHGLAALLFLPWVGVALPQARAVMNHLWIKTPGALAPVETVSEFLLIPPKVPPPPRPLIPEEAPGLSRLPALGGLANREHPAAGWRVLPWFAMGLGAASLLAAGRPKDLLLITALIAVPIAGLWLVSRLMVSIYLDRVLIPALAGIPLLLAAPFVAGWRGGAPGRASWLRRSAMAASGAAWVMMLLTGWHFAEVRVMPGWREAAGLLTLEAKAEDGIVYNAHIGQIVVERYLAGAAAELPAYGLPSGWYEGGVPTVGKWIESDNDLDRLREAAERHRVIWYVRAHTEVHDPAEVARAWCEQNLVVAGGRGFPWIAVIRYETVAALPKGGEET
jgi:4-amino-4-deoxy-L-arabinose transferase-like glycosyltransferase